MWSLCVCHKLQAVIVCKNADLYFKILLRLLKGKLKTIEKSSSSAKHFPLLNYRQLLIISVQWRSIVCDGRYDITEQQLTKRYILHICHFLNLIIKTFAVGLYIIHIHFKYFILGFMALRPRIGIPFYKATSTLNGF